MKTKTISQINEQIKELQKQKKQLEEENSKEFQEIIYKGKLFRIYKWENKPIKNFPIPKGFVLCEASDLIELINEKKLIGEKYCSYYANKLFKNGYYDLFRAYLDWDGNWCADVVCLADSSDKGRVVFVK